MENVSYIGLSQQTALMKQMDITANNLANMSTPGYKSQNVMFTDFLTPPKAGESINQVLDSDNYADVAQGPMNQTHNTLDVAIEGDGYFSVQTPAGTRYTRDGGFSLNSSRELVNKSGYQVLSDGGSTITIPAEASHITISPDGDVSSELGEVGKLKVNTFDAPQSLTRTGENLLDANGAPEKPVDDPHVVQGTLEASNVNPIVQMNKMTELLRMFEMTQTMLQNDHQRMSDMIQQLTKTS